MSPAADEQPPRDQATADAEAVGLFEEHRGLLLSASYRILGSWMDAEDVVQESWIRWSRIDRTGIESPRAYLLTITTRLALNRTRQLATHRESYVGPWLPEPVATDPRSDAEVATGIADEVSMAMLIVLASLTPLERAAFVLIDVFGMTAPEAAEALDRSPAAVRQLAHRARSHVLGRRPRNPVDPRRHREITERFLQTVLDGDVEGFVALLAPDVVLVTDGGGVKQAALRPIHGVDKVTRFLFGVLSKVASETSTLELRNINAETAVVFSISDEVDSVGFLTIESDQVTGLHLVRNPAKLTAV